MADQEKKKKVAIISISSILLVAMVAAVAVGLNHSGEEEIAGEGDGQITASQKHKVDAVCQSTEYKETCEKTLTQAGNNTNDMKGLFRAAFNATAIEIQKHLHNSTLFHELGQDSRTKQALEVCQEVMGYAINNLNESIEKLDKFDFNKLQDYAYDLKIWLSATMTHQQTCLDAFENTTTGAGKKMTKVLNSSMELSSNALDMVVGFSNLLKSLDFGSSSHRKLMSVEEETQTVGGFPSWVSEGQRRLLEGTEKIDVTVAQDGSGDFTTLNDALRTVPKMSSAPYVIHVKAGIYQEYVDIPGEMTHLTIIGDGPTKTRFTGKKNSLDGLTTYLTSTFGVNGNFFTAKDVGFENSAGAEKFQAVALRVTADKAVFYNCHMDGYQDTLYTQSQRQFYRDCQITGTIDFIFGDAAGVFQNCKLIVRKPLDNQDCIVAAGGRMKPEDPNGLVFQSCQFTADPEYLSSRATNSRCSFLARPWRPYAKTVIMDSKIDAFFDPKGYLDWEGESFQQTATAYEFNNKGTGADTAGRVTWPGVKVLSSSEAKTYYPNSFYEIKDASEKDSFIAAAGIPYDAGKMKKGSKKKAAVSS
ncbi:hypothetical protein L6164_012517 [Bauhinia variegata]|uniref:Uncharacterized protein n=1 Tax=Bauhinia variegata TaxID=167791 RepID=A0ACB9P9B2_BAUVA|nr:hypothetical protein L6164_012517 [Bauhinia variegata]